VVGWWRVCVVFDQPHQGLAVAATLLLLLLLLLLGR